MKFTLFAMALWIFTWPTQAGKCPEACKDTCGTKTSCCPSQGQRCGSVELERGGNASDAYSSKGGLRLR